jgi:hypothetical protein
LVNFTKPFLGISTYKISDLQTIATKIGIADDSDTKKPNKTELYAKIVEKCCYELAG